MTEKWRGVKVSEAVDSNANQQSLLVLIADVDSTKRPDLLSVRHRHSPDCAEGRPPSESTDVVDDEETPAMTSSSSSAAAAAGAVDYKHDVAVTPSDDVCDHVSDDVIKTQNYPDPSQLISDKVRP